MDWNLFQVMPILTTTYPLMNSTFNVSQHTLKLIQEKMLVAAGICDRILEGAQHHWEILFKVKIVYIWKRKGWSEHWFSLFCPCHDESFCDDCTIKCLAERPKKSSALLVPYLACGLIMHLAFLIDLLFQHRRRHYCTFKDVSKCAWVSPESIDVGGERRPLKAPLDWPSAARPFFVSAKLLSCLSKLSLLSLRFFRFPNFFYFLLVQLFHYLWPPKSPAIGKEAMQKKKFLLLS